MAEEKIKDQKSKIKTTDKKEKNIVVKKTTLVESAVSAEKMVVKTKEKKATENKGLSVSVYDIAGKEVETIDLPQDVFGAKINKTLMAQAVRVYLANQRQGNASTKTRGEVTGSTRKIYRQKGTGRARHGGVRAPIFVKGGIAHGPKPQDHSLSLPKKMKKAALFSALTAKLSENKVQVISGLEAIEPKTKAIAAVLGNFGLAEKKAKILLVMPENTESIMRSGRNLVGVTMTAADRLNTYEVLNTKKLILMKDSVSKLEEVFLKEVKNQNAKVKSTRGNSL